MTMDRATQRAQHAHIVAALGCGGGGGTVNATHTRACLLAKTPAELLKAIPLGKSHAAGTLSNPSWLMANIFDVPRFADGLRAPGIAAVDGAVVAAPLLEALARPVVDVPLIVSTMAQEPGAWPNNMFNASAMSPAQFQQQLAEDWDQVFGDGFAASVVKLYGADVADNAQKAWDTIAADAGVFCGNKRRRRSRATCTRCTTKCTGPTPSASHSTGATWCTRRRARARRARASATSGLSLRAQGRWRRGRRSAAAAAGRPPPCA
mgnify:CR=1 FL=1